MRGKTVRNLVLAGATIIATAAPVAGVALARAADPSLYLKASSRAGRTESLFIGGVTNDYFEELVVYRDPKVCEKTNHAQERRPEYAERLTWHPISHTRSPSGNIFTLAISLKDQAKGEHLVCAFLVNGGETGASAELRYTVT